MRSNFHTPTRRVRRYIQLALAGAALGTVGIAAPSYAGTVTVSNTDPSGAGSLSQAITDANAAAGGDTVIFSGLSSGAQFTASLPSITGALTIDSSSGLNTFTVSQGLTTESSTLNLTGNGTSGDYSITSDLTAKGSGYIDISDAYTVNGATVNVINNGTVSVSGSIVDLSGDATLNGVGSSGGYPSIYVDHVSALNAANLSIANGGYLGIRHGSTVTLSGDATVDGTSSEGYLSRIVVETSSALNAANLSITNGGLLDVSLYSTVTLSGDATVDGVSSSGDSSTINLGEDSELNAVNLNVTNGGIVNINPSGGPNVKVNLTGDATADGIGSNGDASSISINLSAELDAVNLNATNGGHIDIKNGSTVDLSGDATVDGRRSDSTTSDIFEDRTNGDSSEINIESSTFHANSLSVTNGGYVRALYSDIFINGDVNVDGEGINNYNSWIDVYYNTLQADNLNVTDGGGFTLFSSTLDLDGTGTATADGQGSDGFASRIEIYNGAMLDGNAVITNGGYLRLGGADITGDVTINANSMLRYDGGYNGNDSNDLNSDGGTTTFNANSLFAPDILTDPIAVDSLDVNNTAQIQPWLQGSYPGAVPVGTQYGRPVILYNSITGPFSADVISPLDVGVEYEDSLNTRTDTPNTGDSGQVQLYLKTNNVDFTTLPGSENAESLGSFLNNAINQSQDDDDVLDLSKIGNGQLEYIAYSAIQSAAENGNLSDFDEVIPTNLSSHNTQAYWNQKSFVDSIRANLDNDRNSEGGGHAFALNQVSGANGTGAQLASLRQATTPGFNHLNYAGDNSSNSSGVWASYNGNHQRTDADSGIGSSDWSSSSDGFTLGYTGGGDSFSWGAAVGHQKSTLDFADLNATGEQTGWNAGLYAAWKGKSGYINGVLGYGNFDNDSNGALGDATFKTKATSASLEIGKHVSNSKSSSLTPYASVLWTRIKQGDATVSGSPLGLTLNSGSNNVYTTQLGVRYNHRMYDKDDTLKGGWQAGLAWLHQGGDTGLPANLGSSLAPGAGNFDVKSTPLAGNSAVVQLGAYGRIHHNLIGYAGYQGTFGSSQKINAVNAGIGYQF